MPCRPPTARRSIAADMQDIDEVIDAHVMQNTPSLISIGKRCMEQGYTFTWPAGELPVLQGPNGKEIVLDVLNNVPYLPASRCNFSSPATNQYPDIPAVPAPSALSGDVIKEGTEDLPSAPEGHPGSPDLDPPASVTALCVVESRRLDPPPHDDSSPQEPFLLALPACQNGEC